MSTVSRFNRLHTLVAMMNHMAYLECNSFNHYTAELFRTIFHSFEAGIANIAISAPNKSINVKWSSAKCNYLVN